MCRTVLLCSYRLSRGCFRSNVILKRAYVGFRLAEILGMGRWITDFDPLQVGFVLRISWDEPPSLLINPASSVPHHQAMVLHGESAPLLQNLRPLGCHRAGKRCVWNRRKQNAVELLNHAAVRRMHAWFGILRQDRKRKQNAGGNNEGEVPHTDPQFKNKL